MHRLIAFFSLTFAISWACFLALAVYFPHPADSPIASQALLLLGTFGPAIAALVLLRPKGILELNWTFSPRWAPFAVLFLAVLKLAVAILARAVTGSWPRFGTEGPLVIAAAIVLSTPFQAGEELGWRGFALPRMAAWLGYGPAALLLGVIWGVWHLPLFFVRGEYSGQSFPMFAAGTTALSIAIAFLYVRTG